MIRVRQVRIKINDDNIDNIRKKIVKMLRIENSDIVDLSINKKSIDARDKNDIFYVYEIDLKLKSENKIRFSDNVVRVFDEEYKYVPNLKKDIKPIVVGAGPAGLFCAYFLAKYGYKPLIIERGECIEKRVSTVEKFWDTGILDKNSNVQFGEGGAGTFSDGKLNTLVKDKEFRMKKVFEIFIECGAPLGIIYEKNPHIGTDILRKVIINMRKKIIEMGGVFKYNTTLTDIKYENGFIKEVIVNGSDTISCDALVLAIGHSARDTFRMLNERGVEMSSKPFAIGTRIEHDQSLIDENQYGKWAKCLGSANYKLSYQSSSFKGVYSFCMCPGGYVINSSSEANRLVVNGMSNYKRDSGKANSAIVVTVNQDDYGDELFSGMELQESLEERAYKLGNGKIPIQSFCDFESGGHSCECEDYTPCIKGGYIYSNLSEIFPDYIKKPLIEGINNFDRKIKGFKNGLLIGVETRTSSPIRINRDGDLMSNIKGIYPCGEGSGYAGGITTSAMDGIKVFEKITN